mmetsp:Transcript_3286/g.4784  ORF Transcript_3286/g.4784 Transcript_3286/m.4784 type:complete len:213 (-) Transcript_3286:1404-2042(-)
MIPHPEIPIATLRPNDILLLLFLGTTYELASRLLSTVLKSKSSHEKTMRTELQALKYEVVIMRNKGPSTFVETSKLERAVLKKESELDKLEEEKKVRVTTFIKFQKNTSYGLSLLVFVLYYGVPLLVLDGMRIPDFLSETTEEEADVCTDVEKAERFFKAWLFPISYIGLGRKLSSLGLEQKGSSIGALIVYWSGQVTTGKIMECLEALAWR